MRPVLETTPADLVGPIEFSIRSRDSRSVVQAWFQGMNPQLDDVPPARLLREGQVDDAAQAVLAAAKAFAAAG